MSAARARSRRHEAGYAMLLVFLMASVIAIALYRELPRFAFEQQRAKEELLIERGEQYKRAIQVFVRKMNRYPATIEELESTNNIRFLRKRYLDPMTGKDKWRLIHVNGGVLTDSIIQKTPNGQTQPQQNTNTFIAEGPVLGATTDPNQAVNPAMRRRPSDERPVAAPDAPDQPQPAGDDTENLNPPETDPNGNPIAQPNPVPVTGVMPTPGQTMPGTPMNRFPYPNQGAIPGQPGQMAGQFNPMQPGTLPPGVGGYPGAGPPTSTPQQFGLQGQQAMGQGMNQGLGQGINQGMSGINQGMGGMNQGMGGMNQGMGGLGQNAGGLGQSPSGFGQPASQFGMGNGAQNGQAGNIGNMLGLNGPRPGGMTGLPGMGGTQVGGGIAGVASEAKDPAIIVYNERKKYNEWEFVYDKSKDRGLAGVQGNGGVPGTQASQMGNMPPGMGTNGAPGNNSGFGNSSFGSGSSFGQSSSGFGQSSSGFGQPSTGFGQAAPQQPQPPPQQPQN